MKKIIIFNIAVLFMASSAFADAITFGNAGKEVLGTGGPATNAKIGKLSTKVGLGWTTNANGYSIYTQHQQGTKAFGTSYDSTSIYVLDVTTIGTAVTQPTGTGSSAFNNWATM